MHLITKRTYCKNRCKSGWKELDCEMFTENIQQIEIQRTEEIYQHLSGKSLSSFETILVCRRIVIRSVLRGSSESSQF